VPRSKLFHPWHDIVATHLLAAQQQAQGNAAEGFQLYTAQGWCTNPLQQTRHSRTWF
jgi:hypothetical protein